MYTSSDAAVRKHARALYQDLGVVLPLGKYMAHVIAGDRLPLRTTVVGANGGKESTEIIGAPPSFNPGSGGTATSVASIMNLPPEVQRPILIEVLLPNLRWPRRVMWAENRQVWGDTPDVTVQYETALEAARKAYRDMFRNLVHTNRYFRDLLTGTEFRRDLYKAWYRRPVEGLDGHLDPNTSPTQTELRHMTVPDFLGTRDRGNRHLQMGGWDWYSSFYESVLNDRTMRWKVMASVRLWRILFVTRRLARIEANQNDLLTPVLQMLPDLSESPQEDDLENRLPATAQELKQRYPEMAELADYASSQAKFGIFARLRWIMYVIWKHESGSIAWRFLHENTVSPTSTFGEIVTTFPTGRVRDSMHDIITTLRNILVRSGAVAPGVISLVISGRIGYQTYFRMPQAPSSNSRGWPQIRMTETDRPSTFGLSERERYLRSDPLLMVNVFRIPTFGGVPYTADANKSGQFRPGDSLVPSTKGGKSRVIRFDKPIDLGIDLFSRTAPDGIWMSRKQSTFCLGSVNSHFRLDLKNAGGLYIGDVRAFGNVLLRFIFKNNVPNPTKAPVLVVRFPFGIVGATELRSGDYIGFDDIEVALLAFERVNEVAIEYGKPVEVPLLQNIRWP